MGVGRERSCLFSQSVQRNQLSGVVGGSTQISARWRLVYPLHQCLAPLGCTCPRAIPLPAFRSTIRSLSTLRLTALPSFRLFVGRDTAHARCPVPLNTSSKVPSRYSRRTSRCLGHSGREIFPPRAALIKSWEAPTFLHCQPLNHLLSRRLATGQTERARDPMAGSIRTYDAPPLIRRGSERHQAGRKQDTPGPPEGHRFAACTPARVRPLGREAGARREAT